MDYQAIEETVRAGYREATPRYRKDDEIEVTTSNHRRLGRILNDVCHSFSSPIAVLELGCGTGRYFHCLEQVDRLVGVDISEEMLAAARNPVLADEVTAKDIELIRGNTFLISFPPASFDFIYSLGMFGLGCPVTVEICNRFHEWLKPGGKLFFDTVDLAGTSVLYRLRRKLRKFVYPALPHSLQATLDERERRWPFFPLTKPQLERLMSETRFSQYTISSHKCLSPLWKGRHLECFAVKDGSKPAWARV